MLNKKNVKAVVVGALFAAAFSVGVSKANALENQSPWVKSSMDDSSYCHLKFPAARQSSLNTNDPQLKVGSGDMIDYYGPCNHDPLSQDELSSQRNELNLQWEMNYESE